METREIKAKGTATIDIEAYDELMTIKNGLYEKNAILLDIGYTYHLWKAYRVDDVNLELNKANEEYRKKVDELREQLKRKENEVLMKMRSMTRKEREWYIHSIII